MKEDEVLCRAAERARLRPEYCGWILAKYEALEGVDEAQLQNELCASATHWISLHLCLRPRPECFISDITAIATKCRVDRDTLAMIVRRVDAIEMLQKDPTLAAAGSLLAARTRNKNRPKGGSDGP